MASADWIVAGLVGWRGLRVRRGIASGRPWLLASYDPDSAEDERRVVRSAAGTAIAFGPLTLGLAWGLWIGLAGDWWWADGTLAALALGA